MNARINLDKLRPPDSNHPRNTLTRASIRRLTRRDTLAGEPRYADRHIHTLTGAGQYTHLFGGLAEGESMRHFIAYHNTEKMGRALHDGEPLRLLTNKHVNHLLQQTVWFVTGEGAGARQYSLGSVFSVAEVGGAAEDGFKRFAAGPGHVFEPPVAIKDMPWFPEVLRATGHFGLGVQEVKDEAVIAGMIQLAAQHGYEVLTRQYPEPKERELTDDEKRQLRERIERGDADIYVLAREFGCTSSQVAGVKAAMNR